MKNALTRIVKLAVLLVAVGAVDARDARATSAALQMCAVCIDQTTCPTDLTEYDNDCRLQCGQHTYAGACTHYSHGAYQIPGFPQGCPTAYKVVVCYEPE